MEHHQFSHQNKTQSNNSFSSSTCKSGESNDYTLHQVPSKKRKVKSITKSPTYNTNNENLFKENQKRTKLNYRKNESESPTKAIDSYINQVQRKNTQASSNTLLNNLHSVHSNNSKTNITTRKCDQTPIAIKSFTRCKENPNTQYTSDVSAHQTASSMSTKVIPSDLLNDTERYEAVEVRFLDPQASPLSPMKGGSFIPLPTENSLECYDEKQSLFVSKVEKVLVKNLLNTKRQLYGNLDSLRVTEFTENDHTGDCKNQSTANNVHSHSDLVDNVHLRKSFKQYIHNSNKYTADLGSERLSQESHQNESMNRKSTNSISRQQESYVESEDSEQSNDQHEPEKTSENNQENIIEDDADENEKSDFTDCYFSTDNMTKCLDSRTKNYNTDLDENGKDTQDTEKLCVVQTLVPIENILTDSGSFTNDISTTYENDTSFSKFVKKRTSTSEEYKNLTCDSISKSESKSFDKNLSETKTIDMFEKKSCKFVGKHDVLVMIDNSLVEMKEDIEKQTKLQDITSERPRLSSDSVETMPSTTTSCGYRTSDHNLEQLTEEFSEEKKSINYPVVPADTIDSYKETAMEILLQRKRAIEQNPLPLLSPQTSEMSETSRLPIKSRPLSTFSKVSLRSRSQTSTKLPPRDKPPSVMSRGGTPLPRQKKTKRNYIGTKNIRVQRPKSISPENIGSKHQMLHVQDQIEKHKQRMNARQSQSFSCSGPVFSRSSFDHVRVAKVKKTGSSSISLASYTNKCQEAFVQTSQSMVSDSMDKKIAELLFILKKYITVEKYEKSIDKNEGNTLLTKKAKNNKIDTKIEDEKDYIREALKLQSTLDRKKKNGFIISYDEIDNHKREGHNSKSSHSSKSGNTPEKLNKSAMINSDIISESSKEQQSTDTSTTYKQDKSPLSIDNSKSCQRSNCKPSRLPQKILVSKSNVSQTRDCQKSEPYEQISQDPKSKQKTEGFTKAKIIQPKSLISNVHNKIQKPTSLIPRPINKVNENSLINKHVIATGNPVKGSRSLSRVQQRSHGVSKCRKLQSFGTPRSKSLERIHWPSQNFKTQPPKVYHKKSSENLSTQFAGSKINKDVRRKVNHKKEIDNSDVCVIDRGVGKVDIHSGQTLTNAFDTFMMHEETNDKSTSEESVCNVELWKNILRSPTAKVAQEMRQFFQSKNDQVHEVINTLEARESMTVDDIIAAYHKMFIELGTCDEPINDEHHEYKSVHDKTEPTKVFAEGDTPETKTSVAGRCEENLKSAQKIKHITSNATKNSLNNPAVTQKVTTRKSTYHNDKSKNVDDDRCASTIRNGTTLNKSKKFPRSLSGEKLRYNNAAMSRIQYNAQKLGKPKTLLAENKPHAKQKKRPRTCDKMPITVNTDYESEKIKSPLYGIEERYKKGKDNVNEKQKHEEPKLNLSYVQKVDTTNISASLIQNSKLITDESTNQNEIQNNKQCNTFKRQNTYIFTDTECSENKQENKISDNGNEIINNYNNKTLIQEDNVLLTKDIKNNSGIDLTGHSVLSDSTIKRQSFRHLNRANYMPTHCDPTTKIKGKATQNESRNYLKSSRFKPTNNRISNKDHNSIVKSNISPEKSRLVGRQDVDQAKGKGIRSINSIFSPENGKHVKRTKIVRNNRKAQQNQLKSKVRSPKNGHIKQQTNMKEQTLKPSERTLPSEFKKKFGTATNFDRTGNTICDSKTNNFKPHNHRSILKQSTSYTKLKSGKANPVYMHIKGLVSASDSLLEDRKQKSIGLPPRPVQITRSVPSLPQVIKQTMKDTTESVQKNKKENINRLNNIEGTDDMCGNSEAIKCQISTSNLNSMGHTSCTGYIPSCVQSNELNENKCAIKLFCKNNECQERDVVSIVKEKTKILGEKNVHEISELSEEAESLTSLRRRTVAKTCEMILRESKSSPDIPSSSSMILLRSHDVTDSERTEEIILPEITDISQSMEIRKQNSYKRMASLNIIKTSEENEHLSLDSKQVQRLTTCDFKSQSNTDTTINNCITNNFSTLLSNDDNLDCLMLPLENRKTETVVVPFGNLANIQNEVPTQISSDLRDNSKMEINLIKPLQQSKQTETNSGGNDEIFSLKETVDVRLLKDIVTSLTAKFDLDAQRNIQNIIKNDVCESLAICENISDINRCDTSIELRNEDSLEKRNGIDLSVDYKQDNCDLLPNHEQKKKKPLNKNSEMENEKFLDEDASDDKTSALITESLGRVICSLVDSDYLMNDLSCIEKNTFNDVQLDGLSLNDLNDQSKGNNDLKETQDVISKIEKTTLTSEELNKCKAQQNHSNQITADIEVIQSEKGPSQKLFNEISKDKGSDDCVPVFIQSDGSFVLSHIPNLTKQQENEELENYSSNSLSLGSSTLKHVKGDELGSKDEFFKAEENPQVNGRKNRIEINTGMFDKENDACQEKRNHEISCISKGELSPSPIISPEKQINQQNIKQNEILISKNDESSSTSAKQFTFREDFQFKDTRVLETCDDCNLPKPDLNQNPETVLGTKGKNVKYKSYFCQKCGEKFNWEEKHECKLITPSVNVNILCRENFGENENYPNKAELESGENVAFISTKTIIDITPRKQLEILKTEASTTEDDNITVLKKSLIDLIQETLKTMKDMENVLSEEDLIELRGMLMLEKENNSPKKKIKHDKETITHKTSTFTRHMSIGTENFPHITERKILPKSPDKSALNSDHFLSEFESSQAQNIYQNSNTENKEGNISQETKQITESCPILHDYENYPKVDNIKTPDTDAFNQDNIMSLIHKYVANKDTLMKDHTLSNQRIDIGNKTKTNIELSCSVDSHPCEKVCYKGHLRHTIEDGQSLSLKIQSKCDKKDFNINDQTTMKQRFHGDFLKRHDDDLEKTKDELISRKVEENLEKFVKSKFDKNDVKNDHQYTKLEQLNWDFKQNFKDNLGKTNNELICRTSEENPDEFVASEHDKKLIESNHQTSIQQWLNQGLYKKCEDNLEKTNDELIFRKAEENLDNFVSSFKTKHRFWRSDSPPKKPVLQQSDESSIEDSSFKYRSRTSNMSSTVPCTFRGTEDIAENDAAVTVKSSTIILRPSQIKLSRSYCQDSSVKETKDRNYIQDVGNKYISKPTCKMSSLKGFNESKILVHKINRKWKIKDDSFIFLDDSLLSESLIKFNKTSESMSITNSRMKVQTSSSDTTQNLCFDQNVSYCDIDNDFSIGFWCKNDTTNEIDGQQIDEVFGKYVYSPPKKYQSEDFSNSQWKRNPNKIISIATQSRDITPSCSISSVIYGVSGEGNLGRRENCIDSRQPKSDCKKQSMVTSQGDSVCEKKYLDLRQYDSVFKEHVIDLRQDSSVCKEHVIDLGQDNSVCKEHVIDLRQDNSVCKEHVIDLRQDNSACKEHVIDPRQDNSACEVHIKDWRKDNFDCTEKNLNLISTNIDNMDMKKDGSDVRCAASITPVYMSIEKIQPESCSSKIEDFVLNPTSHFNQILDICKSKIISNSKKKRPRRKKRPTNANVKCFNNSRRKFTRFCKTNNDLHCFKTNPIFKVKDDSFEKESDEIQKQECKSSEQSCSVRKQLSNEEIIICKTIGAMRLEEELRRENEIKTSMDFEGKNESLDAFLKMLCPEIDFQIDCQQCDILGFDELPMYSEYEAVEGIFQSYKKDKNVSVSKHVQLSQTSHKDLTESSSLKFDNKSELFINEINSLNQHKSNRGELFQCNIKSTNSQGSSVFEDLKDSITANFDYTQSCGMADKKENSHLLSREKYQSVLLDDPNSVNNDSLFKKAVDEKTSNVLQTTNEQSLKLSSKGKVTLDREILDSTMMSEITSNFAHEDDFENIFQAVDRNIIFIEDLDDYTTDFDFPQEIELSDFEEIEIDSFDISNASTLFFSADSIASNVNHLNKNNEYEEKKQISEIDYNHDKSKSFFTHTSTPNRNFKNIKSDFSCQNLKHKNRAVQADSSLLRYSEDNFIPIVNMLKQGINEAFEENVDRILEGLQRYKCLTFSEAKNRHKDLKKEEKWSNTDTTTSSNSPSCETQNVTRYLVSDDSPKPLLQTQKLPGVLKENSDNSPITFSKDTYEDNEGSFLLFDTLREELEIPAVHISLSDSQQYNHCPTRDQSNLGSASSISKLLFKRRSRRSAFCKKILSLPSTFKRNICHKTKTSLGITACNEKYDDLSPGDIDFVNNKTGQSIEELREKDKSDNIEVYRYLSFDSKFDFGGRKICFVDNDQSMGQVEEGDKNYTKHEKCCSCKMENLCLSDLLKGKHILEDSEMSTTTSMRKELGSLENVLSKESKLLWKKMTKLEKNQDVCQICKFKYESMLRSNRKKSNKKDNDLFQASIPRPDTISKSERLMQFNEKRLEINNVVEKIEFKDNSDNSVKKSTEFESENTKSELLGTTDIENETESCKHSLYESSLTGKFCNSCYMENCCCCKQNDTIDKSNKINNESDHLLRSDCIYVKSVFENLEMKPKEIKGKKSTDTDDPVPNFILVNENDLSCKTENSDRFKSSRTEINCCKNKLEYNTKIKILSNVEYTPKLTMMNDSEMTSQESNLAAATSKDSSSPVELIESDNHSQSSCGSIADKLSSVVNLKKCLPSVKEIVKKYESDSKERRAKSADGQITIPSTRRAAPNWLQIQSAGTASTDKTRHSIRKNSKGQTRILFEGSKAASGKNINGIKWDHEKCIDDNLKSKNENEILEDRQENPDGHAIPLPIKLADQTYNGNASFVVAHKETKPDKIYQKSSRSSFIRYKSKCFENKHGKNYNSKTSKQCKKSFSSTFSESYQTNDNVDHFRKMNINTFKLCDTKSNKRIRSAPQVDIQAFVKPGHLKSQVRNMKLPVSKTDTCKKKNYIRANTTNAKRYIKDRTKTGFSKLRHERTNGDCNQMEIPFSDISNIKKKKCCQIDYKNPNLKNRYESLENQNIYTLDIIASEWGCPPDKEDNIDTHSACSYEEKFNHVYHNINLWSPALSQSDTDKELMNIQNEAFLSPEYMLNICKTRNERSYSDNTKLIEVTNVGLTAEASSLANISTMEESLVVDKTNNPHCMTINKHRRNVGDVFLLNSYQSSYSQGSEMIEQLHKPCKEIHGEKIPKRDKQAEFLQHTNVNENKRIGDEKDYSGSINLGLRKSGELYSEHHLYEKRHNNVSRKCRHQDSLHSSKGSKVKYLNNYNNYESRDDDVGSQSSLSPSSLSDVESLISIKRFSKDSIRRGVRCSGGSYVIDKTEKYEHLLRQRSRTGFYVTSSVSPPCFKTRKEHEDGKIEYNFDSPTETSSISSSLDFSYTGFDNFIFEDEINRNIESSCRNNILDIDKKLKPKLYPSIAGYEVPESTHKNPKLNSLCSDYEDKQTVQKRYSNKSVCLEETLRSAPLQSKKTFSVKETSTATLSLNPDTKNSSQKCLCPEKEIHTNTEIPFFSKSVTSLTQKFPTHQPAEVPVDIYTIPVNKGSRCLKNVQNTKKYSRPLRTIGISGPINLSKIAQSFEQRTSNISIEGNSLENKMPSLKASDRKKVGDWKTVMKNLITISKKSITSKRK